MALHIFRSDGDAKDKRKMVSSFASSYVKDNLDELLRLAKHCGITETKRFGAFVQGATIGVADVITDILAGHISLTSTRIEVKEGKHEDEEKKDDPKEHRRRGRCDDLEGL